jgi:hypothetical protein
MHSSRMLTRIDAYLDQTYTQSNGPFPFYFFCVVTNQDRTTLYIYSIVFRILSHIFIDRAFNKRIHQIESMLNVFWWLYLRSINPEQPS